MQQLFGMVIFAFILVAGFGCELSPDPPQDPVLASVYGRKLHLSHAEQYLSQTDNPEDSISQLRNYVEQWVREAVLLHEAEQYVPVDVDIMALVEDYRASLLISNYEKYLVENRVDTVISEEELRAYYDKNKDQYQLEQPIIRCQFVKLPKDEDGIDKFREWWDSENASDQKKLADYCANHAEIYMLEDSTWYRVDEITMLLPPGTLSSGNMRSGRSLRFSDGEYEYYLRIWESVLSKEIAPLSYIRGQAIRFIMHKRRMELLDRMKAELYARELDGNDIKIFTE